MRSSGSSRRMGWVLWAAMACSAAAAQGVAEGGWPAYGGDAGGQRYSPLTQINPANVQQLKLAWTFRTGELGAGLRDWKRSAFEATPVLHEGVLYLTTSATDVVAVDAATGVLRWRHASGARRDKHYPDGVSRGVSLWVDEAAAPGSPCRARVFAPTLDARLLALDAADGQPCTGFGLQGALNLLDGVMGIASAANAWAPLSVDAQRHLVFVPTGSASPDFFGGQRPGDNRWANSLLALDSRTGELRWGRQLVHHDLWDYDLPAQPALVDLQRKGKRVPAVIQATKMGWLFTLDHNTGEPLFAIEERPVPQGAAPGERPSATQPHPVAPPALSRQGPVTADDAWGVAWFDKRACRNSIESYRSEGIFTPPSLQETLMQPGNAGGSNWGGVAFDPQRQMVLANTMNLPFVVALVPRAEFEAQRADPRYAGWEFAPQSGTPYGMRRKAFISQLGMPGIGGPIVTASGLVFIAASFDDRLRAFSTHSGELLWQVKLPAGGQATPMTYAVGGRQFLVIAAGGYKDASTRGDHLVAYALP